jgi:YgiT-type zinc finger domain-containing protein
MERDDSPRTPCPRCEEGVLAGQTVRSAIWRGERIAVVEDIPAQVCTACGEHFYDEDVSDALRALNEQGFPEAAATRTVVVPVFSLAGRVRKRVPLPADSDVG